MFAPVLRESVVARTLGWPLARVVALVDALGLPVLEIEPGLRVVDPAALAEHLRSAGDEQAWQRLGGDAWPRGVVAAVEERVSARPELWTCANADTVLRAALDAHGGRLSERLYATWAAEHSSVFPTARSIVLALGAASWTDALTSCGGRRGVTTPATRAEARATLRRFADEHPPPGRTLVAYARWARTREVRWKDGQRLAEATGYARWKEALLHVDDDPVSDQTH